MVHNETMESGVGRQRHTEELQAYERALRQSEGHDEAFFFEMVERGFDILNIMPVDLQHGLGVSRATVHRWMTRRCAPAPLSRKLVYNWLRRRAQSSRRQIGRSRTRDETVRPAGTVD